MPGSNKLARRATIILLLLVTSGCASQPFISPDVASAGFLQRQVTQTQGPVTIHAAVPDAAETESLFGLPLYDRNIQPVWVEVKNDSSKTYRLLPSGIDPDYFSPSDAAFAFHGSNNDQNQALDKTFRKLQFRNPIPAGASISGFILSNLDEGFKAVDVDLISQQDVKNYSFIIADPEFRADHKEIDFDTQKSAYSRRDSDVAGTGGDLSSQRTRSAYYEKDTTFFR